MGTTTSPTMEYPGTTTMNQISPTCHHRRSTRRQHSLRHPNSHTIVRHLRICNWRIQIQLLSMAMDNPARMARETHTKPIIISSIGNINLHDYLTTGSSFTHLGIHGQLQRNLVDAQGIL